MGAVLRSVVCVFGGYGMSTKVTAMARWLNFDC